MLQLKNITKSYTVAGYTQNALDGVSVAFRDNEFAAVLGPSGSGKTTMLNVIGGLDRYDSGDLEIDGISTKNYKAGDWDTYRNNRIGFVFQSYNLIPHQNVLSNVELALTLSGVSKRERRARAKQALEDVGLGKHIRKKPNQLSGGQMQRVAIARALINDPEILLADEPTGALDSKTSRHVMELLTKIAKDRLVILVTHNNELAEQYATRTIHLTDGNVTYDSRPYDPETEGRREPTPIRRSRMSFFTAIALSFSNLMTKKGRTFTTAFAGSIGIIGIATIMSFSNGINTYIRNIEEDTLSVYPLSIEQQSFNLSSLFGGHDDEDEESGRRQGYRERPEGTVREIQVVESVFSTQTINDLASLKKHLDANKETLDTFVNAITYTYDITPQIYLKDTSKGADRVHPDSIFTSVMGGGNEMLSFGGMGPGVMMNVYYELPAEKSLYESQYEILAGQWPSKYDEAILILPFSNGIMDFTLYSMGLRDRAELRAMFESVLSGSDMDTEIAESDVFYPYEFLMGAELKVVGLFDTFHYDDTFNIWVDKSGDDAFMEELIAGSIDLKIVGVARASEDASATLLQGGVHYTQELIYYLMEAAQESKIVKEQLANPELNVTSGNTFEYESENRSNTFDFSKIISVDEEAIRNAMPFGDLADMFDPGNMDFSNIDLSGMDMSGMDMNGLDMSSIMNDLDMNSIMSGIDMSDIDPGDFELDLSSIDMSALPPPEFDLGDLAQALAGAVSIPPEALTAIMETVTLGASASIADAVSSIDFAALFISAGGDMTLLQELMSQAITGAVTTAITGYLSDPAVAAGIADQLQNFIDPTVMEQQIQAALQDAVMSAMQEYMAMMGAMIEAQIQAAMAEMMAQMQASIQNAMIAAMTNAMNEISKQMQSAMQDMMQDMMQEVSDEIQKSMTQIFEDIAAQMQETMDSFDSEALAEAFRFEMNEETVYELMSSMMNPSTTSYEQNLSLFGYASKDEPTRVTIYPLSFESKQNILDFLDGYNAEMERTGQEDKMIYFTDIVGLMMSSVTNIVDIVSYALIAFVSVSLVVSSIMIGVITFVSVLERKKEIGILRAVGASKGNIRLVFNAETLIIGFTAGVIGIVVTSFIVIAANIILENLVDVKNLVIMDATVPVLLIAVSMFLTFLAGLIPAQAAASKPPVEALRSE